MRGLKYAVPNLLGGFFEVAPLAGAWIEIPIVVTLGGITTPSHPSRVRGLKYDAGKACDHLIRVAPLAGAWIEIAIVYPLNVVLLVAPLAGAWIEMAVLLGMLRVKISRTPRGCVD